MNFRTYARSFYRLYVRRDPEDIVNRRWHAQMDVERPRWLGTPIAKFPTDLWLFQELVADTHPDVVVETGAAYGGSALFFASLLDLLGHGRVVSVDLWLRGDVPQHPRIVYVQGSSIAPEVVERVRELVGDAERVLVVLDSDHSAEHVLAELRAYTTLVRPGGYVVVEDTHLGGRPVAPGFGAGPAEAVEAFLHESDAFEVDRSRERFGVTSNPGGWLRRVR